MSGRPCKPRCGCGKHSRQRQSLETKWAYDLKLRHGLTPAEWLAMREAQGGQCYLCQRPLSMNSKAAHIDHDHSCCPQGYSCGSCRRGLACSGCNTGIGQFGDDPKRMRAAADALERAQADVDRRRPTRPQQLVLIE
jgi:hypothetical protein